MEHSSLLASVICNVSLLKLLKLFGQIGAGGLEIDRFDMLAGAFGVGGLVLQDLLDDYQRAITLLETTEVPIFQGGSQSWWHQMMNSINININFYLIKQQGEDFQYLLYQFPPMHIYKKQWDADPNNFHDNTNLYNSVWTTDLSKLYCFPKNLKKKINTEILCQN